MLEVNGHDFPIVMSENSQLLEIIETPSILCSFLDAIALFEIVGSRWMLAVPFEYWDEEIHEHCGDEIGHTRMLQDVARRIRGSFSSEEYLEERKFNQFFYDATEEYLNKLSKKIYKFTLKAGRESSRFALDSYALTAFLIERRIMKIYPTIARLSDFDFVVELANQVIKDERKHLHFVGDRLPSGLELAQLDKNNLIMLEEILANDWLGKLSEKVHEG